jgi:acetylornithine deacetylase/succinyl-diaminopimelate desuccinylase-like protein
MISELPPVESDLAERLQSAVDRRFHDTLEDLATLVAIPGIAWEAFPPEELERSARAVSALAQASGFEDVQILRAQRPDGAPGGPAVVARHPAAPGKPTVLLYAHHDVQPPGDVTLWETAPFDPVVRDGRLYGRGAADDKAGLMVHFAAWRALREVLGEAGGVGVTLFIEGEEEAGSPSFRPFLETYRAQLAADVIVVADSGNWAIGVPALTTSLRGLVDGTITLTILDHALHSGVYGGPILDAPTLLARLISTFHDDEGNVAVQGLVVADDPDVEYPEQQFRADAGMLDGVQLAGSGSIAARLWSRPALSIIGMDVPAIAVSSNTIHPTARAKFSLRIAPGQNPAAAMEAVRRHVEAHTPFGAHVDFAPGESGNPYLADTSSPTARLALDALRAAWQTEPVQMGMGGSIPFVAHLKAVFPEAEVLITGVEDPDTRAHSSNESVHVEEFRRAVVAEALMLAGLSMTER